MGPRPETRLMVRDAAEASVQCVWYILAVSTAIIQTVQTTGHLVCPREISRPAVPVQGNLSNGSKAWVPNPPNKILFEVHSVFMLLLFNSEWTVIFLSQSDIY